MIVIGVKHAINFVSISVRSSLSVNVIAEKFSNVVSSRSAVIASMYSVLSQAYAFI
jgi:hypothetical protein